MVRTVTHAMEMTGGQASVLCLDEGDRLRVLAGSVSVREAPQWLGERIVMHEADYRIGATHVVGRSGHVCLLVGAARCVLEVTQRAPKPGLRSHVQRIAKQGLQFVLERTRSSKEKRSVA